MEKSNIRVLGLAAVGAAAVAAFKRGRPAADPVHAPGHTHRGPAPDADEAQSGRRNLQSHRNQPWVRRSHSDSNQRRFRR